MPHLSAIIEYFTYRIKDFFSENLKGIFISGSLALNDFHPDKSAIDVGILCDQLPDKAGAAKIAQTHKKIKIKRGRPPLNCVYIPSSVFSDHHPASANALHYLRGKFFHPT